MNEYISRCTVLFLINRFKDSIIPLVTKLQMQASSMPLVTKLQMQDSSMPLVTKLEMQGQHYSIGN